MARVWSALALFLSYFPSPRVPTTSDGSFYTFVVPVLGVLVISPSLFGVDNTAPHFLETSIWEPDEWATRLYIKMLTMVQICSASKFPNPLLMPRAYIVPPTTL